MLRTASRIYGGHVAGGLAATGAQPPVFAGNLTASSMQRCPCEFALFTIAAEATRPQNAFAMTPNRTARFAGWLAAIAFAFALTLSAAPQLHERLHDVTANHHCAVTLVASGNCDHSVAASVQAQPDFVPAGPTLSATDPQLLPHAADFALLEHAPPSLS